MDNELVEKMIAAHAADISVIRILLCEIASISPEKERLLQNFAAAVEAFSREKPAGVNPEHVIEVRARAEALVRLLRYPSPNAGSLGT